MIVCCCVDELYRFHREMQELLNALKIEKNNIAESEKEVERIKNTLMGKK